MNDKEKFKKLSLDIIKTLYDIDYAGDLSDIGNEIGIVVAKYFSDDLGYEKDDFLSGLRHGISLTDGTH